MCEPFQSWCQEDQILVVTRMPGNGNEECKVQRVKVAAKMPKDAKPPALEEMKVLSEKQIKDFLSKDIVDAASDAEECDNSSSEAIQQQSVGKAKEAGGRPKKLGSRKPTKDKADSIFVGPPPHMASQTVGLRMTEDGWVEVDLGDLPVDLQLGDLPVDHPLKLKGSSQMQRVKRATQPNISNFGEV